MIVTWIAVQCLPCPWEDRRSDVAYVACGERAGELSLVRPRSGGNGPGVERLIESLERAIAREEGKPSLEWLRRAMPDQGTSIRLSEPRRTTASSYEEGIQRIASPTDQR